MTVKVKYQYLNEVPYLNKYVDDKGFRLDKLIDDDFLQAAKLLWRDGRYISSLKLILSFVDTMTFLDNGTTNGSLYQAWLDEYVDLTPLKITSEEVWEHRNSLLHMTTYTSRKVGGGKVARISPYIAANIVITAELQEIMDNDPHTKHYDLHAFILTIMRGVESFTIEINSKDGGFTNFLDNYDEVLSDARYLKLFEEKG